MDICEHPSYLENHGMFLEEKNADTHPKPHTKLFPILVPSKTGLNGDIPVTPIGRDGRRDDVGPDPEWSRKSGKLYWVSFETSSDPLRAAHTFLPSLSVVLQLV